MEKYNHLFKKNILTKEEVDLIEKQLKKEEKNIENLEGSKKEKSERNLRMIKAILFNGERPFVVCRNEGMTPVNFNETVLKNFITLPNRKLTGINLLHTYLQSNWEKTEPGFQKTYHKKIAPKTEQEEN